MENGTTNGMTPINQAGVLFVQILTIPKSGVTPDGSPGPTGEGGFKAEPHRYHLYISYACPWASRAMIMRSLKGLEDIISVSAVNPLMAENGWTFDPAPGVVPDPIIDADYMYEIYTKAEPEYSGRVTVPVLWDKKQNTIVNNESADIMRMFNASFEGLGSSDYNYTPEELLPAIDEVNAEIYDTINNGVYKAGFATKQEVYEEEVTKLFNELDKIEDHLKTNEFLVGDQITEADWRLFTTLVRFDSVYFGHFKCNLKRIVDYENIWRYTRELYNWPGIAKTVNFDHIKEHYYRSHDTINPNGIVPKGPEIDWSLDY